LTKTFLRLLPLLLLSTPAAFAQESASWEIFGGYSVERAHVREYFKSTPILYTFRERYRDLPGWETSITENANDWFGGTLELSGHYRKDLVLGTTNHQKDLTILYGPRFWHRFGPVIPFGHVLFGATHASVTVSPGPHATQTECAVAAGAGVDVRFGKIGVRALKLEYFPQNVIGSKNNRYQASTGLMLYFGKRK